jgi:hypothetical protein
VHLGIPRQGALRTRGDARRGIGRHDRCNYLINGYRQIFPMHTIMIEMTQGPAQFLQMGRINARRSSRMRHDVGGRYCRVFRRDAKATVPRCEITTVVICRNAFSVQYCLVYWLH